MIRDVAIRCRHFVVEEEEKKYVWKVHFVADCVIEDEGGLEGALDSFVCLFVFLWDAQSQSVYVRVLQG